MDNLELAPGLADALDATPQGLAVFDAALRLVFCNARYRELVGLPDEQAPIGASLGEIAHFASTRGDFGPGDAAALAAERIALLTERTGSVSHRRGRDGQTLEVHSAPLSRGGYVLSFVDVTARERADAALAAANSGLEARVAERTAALQRANGALEAARERADAANRDKTRFLAAASHDLLQPLNAARLYTATLIERVGTGDFAALARAIEASLGAVEDILTALLEISRLDAGALQPRAASFVLSDLAAKVAVEFGPAAGAKSIRLRVVSSRATVVADRAFVARIVQNLVSNAIKYTRDGGTVLVGFRRRSGRLRLDVIDTGVGFDMRQKAHLFAEFSRLDQGARMAPGLGLGLSIVQRLVAAMGLTLDVASIVDQGSRFSLHLPAGGRVQAPAADAAAPPPAAVSLVGLRVLCIDNEHEILDALAGLLAGWGCETRTAASLKDIDRAGLIAGWLPDVALVDYHLDQASGLDAIEWLRQNIGGHLPAALVTADRSEGVRALAQVRGVPVLTKPVKPAALRAVLGHLTRVSSPHAM